MKRILIVLALLSIIVLSGCKESVNTSLINKIAPISNAEEMTTSSGSDDCEDILDVDFDKLTEAEKQELATKYVGCPRG